MRKLTHATLVKWRSH